MSFPVVASSATVVTDATNATCVIGKPSGTASGDLLIAFLTTTGATKPSGLPSGWAEIDTQTNSSSGGVLTCYYLVAGGSEPASYTWTLAASNYSVGAIHRITGQHATPLGATPTKSQFTSTPTCTSPSITTVAADSLILRGVGCERIIVAPTTPPTSHTEVCDLVGTASFEAGYLTVASIGQAGIGASGTADFTQSANQFNSNIVIAIAPSLVSASRNLTLLGVG